MNINPVCALAPELLPKAKTRLLTKATREKYNQQRKNDRGRYGKAMLFNGLSRVCLPDNWLCPNAEPVLLQSAR
jgi:hypothetical protein